MAGRVVVKQVRSVAGRDPRTKKTMLALGLRKIGDRKEYPRNPALLGMIRAVSHLVSVEER